MGKYQPLLISSIFDDHGWGINDLIFKLFRNLNELVVYTSFGVPLMNNTKYASAGSVFSVLRLIGSIKYFNHKRFCVIIYGNHASDKSDPEWLFTNIIH